jgi:predicted Fe-Mo cluster-binding NifX family protein
MSYKIAVTSTDGIHINMHFGQADSFHILEIDELDNRWHDIEFRQVPDIESNISAPDRPSCNGRNETRLNAIAVLLSDCAYLLTEKIGLIPYRVLQRQGITSLETPGKLDAVVEKLNAYHIKQPLKLGTSL